MNYSDYRFTLDVQIHQAQVSVPVSLNDTARRLCIGLTDGRKPYTIEDGCIASFVAKKPDGNKLHNSCVIERNTIIYEFTPQTTNVEGVVNCEIRLHKDGVLLVSPQFIIVVDKQVVRDDEIVFSENEYTSITQLIHAEAERQNKFENNETARQEAFIAAEAKRQNEFENGETERQNALGGKVDNITDTWSAYTTDGNGNTVAKKLASKPADGGIALYNKGGILKTNAPVADNDSANKKWTEENFVPIYTAYPSKIYGTGGSVGNVTQRFYSMSPIGTTQGDILNFHTATSTSFDNREPTCTIGVCDPINPIQVANKRYADNGDKAIRQDVDKLESIVYGSIADFVTHEFQYNPAYLPPSALPFAIINKLGTGLKEIISLTDVLPEAYESSGFGERVSATSFRFNTDDYLDAQVQFAIPLNGMISGHYEWEVSIVSGSYEMQDGGTLKAEDTMNYHPVELGVCFGSNVTYETSYFDIFLRNGGVPVKFNDLVLKIEVRAKAVTGFEGVPICGLQIDGKTIYTVPKEIQDLEYMVLNVAGDVTAPVYGLAMSESVYNYIDFDEKKYVVRCAVCDDGKLHEVNDYIDISAYLTDDDGEIEVKPDCNILFIGTDGYSVGERACNTITYMTEKGA